MALSAGNVSAQAQEKASVRLKWLPQAQFAGYYVARPGPASLQTTHWSPDSRQIVTKHDGELVLKDDDGRVRSRFQVPLGAELAGGIVDSNTPALSLAVQAAGGVPHGLGLARDSAEELIERINEGLEHDVLADDAADKRIRKIDELLDPTSTDMLPISISAPVVIT